MKRIQNIFLITLFALLHTVAFAQLSTNGSETKVNSTTVHSQQNPAIAMDASGNYVVVWESYGTDGSGYGIYFQRYNTAGVAQGSETKVNNTTYDDQRFPDIAMDKNGKFTIVWQSDNQDGDGLGIYAAMFNADGTTAKSEFRINTITTGEQRQPSIAMEDDGAFVVAWSSPDADGSGILAQRYSNTGTADGSVISVNSTTTNSQCYPDIAMDYSGNFIITWQSLKQDGNQNGIYFQRYNAAGVAQGSETKTNTTTSNSQQSPSVAASQAGDFIIVWESYGQDATNTYGIYGQRYKNDGTTNGNETKINTTTENHQTGPQVAMDKSGNYVVTWSSYETDGSFYGVYLQAFKADGTTNGSQLVVNTRTTDFQQKPAIALEHDNAKATVVWQDGLNNSNSTHDGDGYGIYSQKYTVVGALPVEMLTFTAQKVVTHVLLEWQTTTELNNSHFDVEWSRDGINFEKIGEVAGAGTTNEVLFYEFLHEYPVNGENYYRLRQVDFDEKYEYTEILNIEFHPDSYRERNIKYRIFPNPASYYLKIESEKLIGEMVQIFNVNGQLVETFYQNVSIQTINITNLPSGTYFIKMGEQTKKVIIQK